MKSYSFSCYSALMLVKYKALRRWNYILNLNFIVDTLFIIRHWILIKVINQVVKKIISRTYKTVIFNILKLIYSVSKKLQKRVFKICYS